MCFDSYFKGMLLAAPLYVCWYPFVSLMLMCMQSNRTILYDATGALLVGFQLCCAHIYIENREGKSSMFKWQQLLLLLDNKVYIQYYSALLLYIYCCQVYYIVVKSLCTGSVRTPSSIDCPKRCDLPHRICSFYIELCWCLYCKSNALLYYIRWNQSMTIYCLLMMISIAQHLYSHTKYNST